MCAHARNSSLPSVSSYNSNCANSPEAVLLEELQELLFASLLKMP